MEILTGLFDFILHIDKHLAAIISEYGVLTYAILSTIIFVETGLVIMPFLPGDSMLFAAGTFAALGSLNPWLMFGLLSAAAILGDTVNYWLGYKIGDRAYSSKWIKREHLDHTHAFFEKHGGKTIVIARFAPFLRTFAPFVAGMGKMSYRYFLYYNIVGGIAWVGTFVFLGYFFGNLPFVKENFKFVILAIIVISLIPAVVGWWKAKRENS